MASEDLFKEDFSEEIITQLDQQYVENVDVSEAKEPTHEQETEDDITGVALEIESTETDEIDSTAMEEVVSTQMDEIDSSAVEEADTTAVTNTEEVPSAASNAAPNTTEPVNNEVAKLFQLPLTRIRNIMKLDPDLHIVSNEAVFLVTRATELFIESLAVESYTFTAQAKKKTVQKRDVDLAISAVDSLMFLDGAMTF